MIKNEYRPDVVSRPGATLEETLLERGMTQVQFAQRTGRPLKLINEIIKGKASITPETALQFEQVLGIPARFWNNRESQYREYLARVAENERQQEYVAWAESFPIKEMVQHKWLPEVTSKIERVQTMLRYFGVVSPDQWDALWAEKQPAFRKSQTFSSDKAALIAWLRKGEIDASAVQCDEYEPQKFLKALTEARTLTVKPPEEFGPRLIDVCRKAGVAVVFVKELPKTRASGATHWISPKKALLQMSLRYKTNDYLWFTFFHEAAHIVKHGKREFFIENHSAKNKREEAEANEFGGDFLIPARELSQFVARNLFTRGSVNAFASSIGIAPGIVVGRLQHDNVIPRSYLNDLKVKLEWA
jgi:plasmid maintenance system antidote protein VapI